MKVICFHDINSKNSIIKIKNLQNMTNIYNNIMQNKSLKRVIYVIYKNTKKTFQMSLLYITKKMLV